MSGTTDAATPKTKVFSTTFVKKTCFQVTWLQGTDAVVTYNSECRYGDAIAAGLKLVENPENTFTIDTKDNGTMSLYQEYVAKSNTYCEGVVKFRNGDTKKIVYSSRSTWETLQLSVGGIQGLCTVYITQWSCAHTSLALSLHSLNYSTFLSALSRSL
ncbi:hypothetical protein FOZ61_004442 [Perkinsus olseni]|uniref:Uncharacterized protein n=1 Tax=Perkinsus olseni TaxID=32597 RepID=A0A7J6LKP3_PEROL|nr:hypothetical protein FOZ61_004442 [Perkinsus olseni]